MIKKTIIIIIIFFFLLKQNILAAPRDSLVSWELIPGFYAHRSGLVNPTILTYIRANGRIVYCIEPGIISIEDYYSSYTDRSTFNIPSERLRYFELVGYYGYEYPGHQTHRYYMASQEIYWHTLGIAETVWRTEKNGGTVIDISYEKNEINRLIDRHLVTPEFNVDNNYITNDEFTITDINNILDEYKIMYDRAEMDINIVEDKMIIKPKRSRMNQIIFERKIITKPITTIYRYNGYQDLGGFGLNDLVTKVLKINSQEGTLNINVVSNNNFFPFDYNYPPLEGSEYIVYNNQDEQIKTLIINNNNIATLNLSAGSYYVQQKNIVKEYKSNQKKYFFEINNNKKQVDINIIEDVITNNVLVAKDGVIDENIEVCINNNEAQELFCAVLENNALNFYLPLGIYTITQKTYTDKYQLLQEPNLIVNNNNIDQSFYFIKKALEPGFDAGNKSSVKEETKLIVIEQKQEVKHADKEPFYTDIIPKMGYTSIFLLPLSLIGVALILKVFKYEDN